MPYRNDLINLPFSFKAIGDLLFETERNTPCYAFFR